MKILEIRTGSLETILTQLQQQLGGNYSEKLKEHTLTVANQTGNGSIRAVQIKGGISFLEFNITFKEDIKISIESPVINTVNFMYCAEGSMGHQFEDNAKVYTLDVFQTGIVSTITQSKSILYFKKDVHVSSSLISINCDSAAMSTQNVIMNQLKETFINNRGENYTFIGSYNLKIAEKIQQLNAISQEGVVRILLIEGLVHIILALEIQQHKRDIANASSVSGSLTQSEMNAIKELSEFINNYPETSLTVSQLCRKIGLTSSKLQEGFKRMHNHTVNDYIREVRVKKSEELIKTTDLNISQIVYTVGFSSRSYFSKIFKQKYKCSPNEYKSKNRLAIPA